MNIFSDIISKSIKTRYMVPMQFNTIGVSDGISMGTPGMRYSLPSRELISDSKYIWKYVLENSIIFQLCLLFDEYRACHTPSLNLDNLGWSENTPFLIHFANLWWLWDLQNVWKSRLYEIF